LRVGESNAGRGIRRNVGLGPQRAGAVILAHTRPGNKAGVVRWAGLWAAKSAFLSIAGM
jgi:hypothetical protein